MDRLRRALTAASAVAALWGLAIYLSGGIILDVAGVAITSRNPRNPFIAAVVFALIAFALPMPNRRQVMAAFARRWVDRLRRYHSNAPWWLEPSAIVAAASIFLQVLAWAFARPLWLDEQLIALNLRDRSFSELGGALWLGQSAPYGWLAVERTVLLTLGSGERALRLLPLLFGCATVTVAFWAGRRWMGRTGAFVLVVLCGFGQWITHYPLELKHYSADAFFGLLLPVMALWTLEEEQGRLWRRRATAWWVVASIGLWLSYGAIFVAPVCAIALVFAAWRRNGMTAAARVALTGSVWMASFALHYFVSLRYSSGSTYLHDYWASAFPPRDADVAGALAWSWQQLSPLALIPGGTEWGLTFWLTALGGFVAAWLIPGPRLPSSAGPLLAAVPLSAFLLSIVRVVPMQDRLALWMVPALYFGVALLADAAARLAGRIGRDEAATDPTWPGRALPAAGALIAAIIVSIVSADIVSRGWNEVRAGRLPGSNHGLDDRSAIRWLLEQRQPGDVIASTHLGVPAIWWYGKASMIDAAGGGGALGDGTPIVTLGRAGSEEECERENLIARTRGHRRLLFYSGFPDEPAGFDEAVLRGLAGYGAVVAEQRFAEGSRAVVVELRGTAGSVAASSDLTTPSQRGAATEECVIGRIARRW